jgi:ankyrin repeat protein
VINSKGGQQEKLDGMLLRSAEKGRARSVETILNSGANIEAKDNNYWTALLLAISKGETETCMLLIERGAKFGSEHSNSYGLALEMAGICRYKDTVAFLKSMKPLQAVLGKGNIMPFSLAFKECIAGGV